MFRLGVGWKYFPTLTLSLPALIIQAWPTTLAASTPTITLLASSGTDPARALRIGWAMWLIPGLLAAYQLVVLNPRAAVVVPGNLPLVVLTARLLTLTTPTPKLLDALIVALRLIRSVGLNSERVALAVALMIRFILYLLGLFNGARDAARVCGAGRNVAALLMSTVLGLVVYAERTGEALATRGPGEREQ